MTQSANTKQTTQSPDKPIVATGAFPRKTLVAALDVCDDEMRQQVETLARDLVDRYHRNRLYKPNCSCVEVKISRETPTAILDLAIQHLRDLKTGWRIERAQIQDPDSAEESYMFNRSLETDRD